MRIFIDLGMYVGYVLKHIVDQDEFDKYIGFEPVSELYCKAKKLLSGNPKVELHKFAVGDSDEVINFYLSDHPEFKDCEIGKGSTLMKDKKTIISGKTRFVQMIDFSKFINDYFSKDDFIVLKIDIEGKEYDLLESMIDSGTIKYIDKIYCEWHYHKIKSIGKERHKELIKSLNKFGFKLTGDNRKDELYRLIKKKNSNRRKKSRGK